MSASTNDHPLKTPATTTLPLWRLTLWTARLVVGGMFLWAAIGKLRDPAAFALSITNYRILPESLVGWCALMVPWIEVVAAAALLTGWGKRGGALIIAAMLVVFTGAITQAILRDINIDCGCFGSATQARVGWSSVLRNLALLAASLLVVFLGPRQPRPNS